MKRPASQQPIVMWRGPSRYDGAPIMVTITPHSSNVKTGDMAQVNILRADIAPYPALVSGADRSICGDCLLRPAERGGCYTFKQVIFNLKSHWQNTHTKAVASPQRVLEAIGHRPVRIGAYGDPAAVPVQVWIDLVMAANKRITAYTHGQRTFGLDGIEHLRGFCMLSVESLDEAARAWLRGWRTYRVILPGGEVSPEEIVCPYEEVGVTCYDCLLCRGTLVRGKSIVIEAHGGDGVINKVRDVVRRGC